MNYVVGSGPAGIACAQALLAQGRRVTLLDVGRQLEPALQQQLDALAATPPSQWPGQPSRFMRAQMDAGLDGIPLKLAYGSEYPYRPPTGASSVRCTGANTKPSYSQGGFSTVWGSALLPVRQADLEGWPITAAELAPHYRALFDFMPVSATQDAIATELPTHAPYHKPLSLSPQAEANLRTLTRNEKKLNARGILFGRSRLAVNAAATAVGGDTPAGSCQLCALCMQGCPWRLIYNSADTLPQLARNPLFTYVSGHLLRRVEESATEVTLHTLDAAGQPQQFTGSRVYLACGTLSTTEILLRSLGRVNQPVTLSDSQYFLLPMLRLAGVPGFQRGGLHTLAQFFLEMMDPAVSPNTVHLQAYTYNELFEAPIRKMLGPLATVFPWNAFLSRLFLFQGYLHSRHSAPITLTLRGDDTLEVTGQNREETKQVLGRVVRKIAALSASLGAVPLFPLLQRGEPGRGFHSGGSFPMRTTADASTSDIYGRPAGLRRIHAVDSTVLPSVPATTITFTVMANAHRIGSAIAACEVGA